MAALTGTDDGTVGYAVGGTDTAPATATGPNGTQTFAGIRGQSTNWYGVYAQTTSGIGVSAASFTNTGIIGKNGNGSGIGASVSGVIGDSDNGCGISGTSLTSDGVRGFVNGNGAAIRGICQSTGGLAGKFDGNVYVLGALGAGGGLTGINGAGSGIGIVFGGGVRGDSDNGWGVIGTSTTYDGVRGEINGNGAAIHGVCHSTGGTAGTFDGNVNVNGDFAASGTTTTNTLNVNGTTTVNNLNVDGTLQVAVDIYLAGADCAEEFDLAEGAAGEPGSVMVIDAAGALMPCERPYDTRAAGVVSGAGEFRPALTLDRRATTTGPRGAIALVGKTYCKVTADGGSIAVGDLLTTSATRGHAMRAGETSKAVGAIIGKAMGDLGSGTGLIPILIALQ